MGKNSTIDVLKNFIFVGAFFGVLWIFRGLIESSTLQFGLAFSVLLVFIVAEMFVIKNKKSNNDFLISRFFYSKIVNIIVFLLALAIFVWIDYDTKDMLGRNPGCIPLKIYIWAFLLSGALFYLMNHLRKYIKMCEVFGNILCIIIICICSLIYYRPYSISSFYNYEAYWLNVTSLYNGVPYSISSTSFYGHYALLLMPFFKLFGLNIYTVQLTQLIEVVVIMVSLFWAVDIIAKKYVSKLIAKVLIGYFFIIGENSLVVYPQGIPHRLFFVSIIIALLIKYIFSNNDTKILKTLINIFCCLSIIWNFETGVVMAAVWVATKSIIDTRNKKKVYLLIYGLKNIMGFIVSVIIGWLFVAIINIAIYNGDYISFGDYIYPLGTDFVGAIGSLASYADLTWILVLGLLVFIFVSSCRKILFDNADVYIESMFTISLSSIMLFPYFYNRAAFFNLHLVSYFQVVLLCLIIGEKLNDEKLFLPVFRYIGCFFSVLLITNSIYTYSNDYFDTLMLGKKAGSFRQFEKEISKVVPENATFYGYGSSYYSMLVENTKALPYNSVNFTQDGRIKTKEFFDEAKNDIVIIGDDEFVTATMGYWIGITLEDIYSIYQVEDWTYLYDNTELSFKILRPNNK